MVITAGFEHLQHAKLAAAARVPVENVSDFGLFLSSRSRMLTTWNETAATDSWAEWISAIVSGFVATSCNCSQRSSPRFRNNDVEKVHLGFDRRSSRAIYHSATGFAGSKTSFLTVRGCRPMDCRWSTIM